MVSDPRVSEIISSDLITTTSTPKIIWFGAADNELAYFASQTHSGDFSVGLLAAAIDEHFQSRWFVTQSNGAGGLILVLTTFSVTSLKRLLKIRLLHLVVLVLKFCYTDSHIRRVFSSTPIILRDALNTMTPRFMFKQGFGSGIFTDKTKLAWSGFL